jgi:Tol biopolymer transport system component
MILRNLLSVVVLSVSAFVFTGCPSTTENDPVNTGSGLTGKVLYTSYISIKELDLKTGAIDVLASGFAATRTPSGSIIAVTADGLVELSPDGSQQRMIVPENTNQPFTDKYDDGFVSPQISPDGRYIAYQGLMVDHVYLVDAATGELLGEIGDDTYGFGRPIWLPDGGLIMEGINAATKGLYRIDPEFQSIVRIDQFPQPRWPSLSPDGKTIATIVGEDVWLIDIDGSNPTQFTTNGLNLQWPTWSPDGKYIMVQQACDLKAIPVGSGNIISIADKFSSFNNNACADDKEMTWF